MENVPKVANTIWHLDRVGLCLCVCECFILIKIDEIQWFASVWIYISIRASSLHTVPPHMCSSYCKLRVCLNIWMTSVVSSVSFFAFVTGICARWTLTLFTFRSYCIQCIDSKGVIHICTSFLSFYLHRSHSLSYIIWTAKIYTLFYSIHIFIVLTQTISFQFILKTHHTRQ